MEAAKETKAKDDGPVGPDGKKLKPCCACPETKRPRDACIMEKVFWCCNVFFLHIIYLFVRVRRTAENWLRLTRLACVLLVSRSKRPNSERLDKKGDLSDIQNTQVIPKRFSPFSSRWISLLKLVCNSSPKELASSHNVWPLSANICQQLASIRDEPPLEPLSQTTWTPRAQLFLPIHPSISRFEGSSLFNKNSTLQLICANNFLCLAQRI